MMTIALRFIPTLLRQLDDLIKAQRARRADLRMRDPMKLGQAIPPLVVPLFVLSFRRAEDLAVAMTSRCYRGGEGRTRYRETRFAARDALAGSMVLVFLAAALTAVASGVRHEPPESLLPARYPVRGLCLPPAGARQPGLVTVEGTLRDVFRTLVWFLSCHRSTRQPT